jgi:peptide/nickel transport system permease protein
LARFVVGRTVGALVTLFVISILCFFTIAMVPGNPAEVMLGTYATPERLAAIEHEFGLDQPLVVRYGYWLKETVQGNLGESVLSHQPVTKLLATALPVTLELTAFALIIAIAFALPVGLRLATNRDKKWSRPAMFGITLGISVPGFWVGLMLIEIFAVRWGILPAGGYVSFREDPVENLKTMILPSVTLSLYLGPPLVRFVRASAVGVLQEDFIKTARTKGISDRAILNRHVRPNALIPSVTFLGLQLGALISGAIVTEVIFALPGMGRLGLNAILSRDYPVVLGVVLVVALGYVLVNLLVDLSYGLIDPRVRAG